MAIDRSKFQFSSEQVTRGYDEYLVPRLFAPWADDLIRSLKPAAGCRALDVATGPGTVARALAGAIGTEGQVTGIDLSAGMIERAQAHGDHPGHAPIAFTTGPAAPLPFGDHTFDVVTCQQGLQFFPDAHAALAEMRRVLVERGKLALSVWKPIEECVVFAAFVEALAASGLDELAGLLTVPFPRWTDVELAARARAAGFAKVEVEVRELDLVFPDGVAQATTAFSGTPIGPMLLALDPSQQARLEAATKATLGRLVDPTGALRGPMRSWVLVARA